MDARTRKSLLARALSTEVIETIAAQGHTVTLLRAMPFPKLVEAYGETVAEQIHSAVNRHEIAPEVVESVLSKSNQCCSLCADGNSTKPFQIHHITPYAETQDNGEDNLLLVCPTHHVAIHAQRVPADAQKSARLCWHSIVDVSRAYSDKAVPFPFDAFKSIAYVGQPRYVEVIRSQRVSGATARMLADSAVAQEAVHQLRDRRFALLTGASGSGKTAVARGVAGIVAEAEGRVVVSYRPPQSKDKRGAAGEILLFLSMVKRAAILIVDDANTFLTVEDLETISASATEHCSILVTATDARVNDDRPLEVAFGDRALRVTWDGLREPVTRRLMQNERDVVPVLRDVRGDARGERVGFDVLDLSLRSLVWRYSDTANTVWQFFFLLRGSWTQIQHELTSLIDSDRADVPVLYAAIEQIADVERFVSPEEVEETIRSMSLLRGPAPTANWVRTSFESQARKRIMVESRGSFTTIHRDWARALISASLADSKSKDPARALLLRDFDPKTSNPRRLMILWSWFYYDEGEAGRFVHSWASNQPWSDWSTLIATAARTSLTDLAFVADRLHLLFRRSDWQSFLGDAYRSVVAPMSSLVAAATANDWWSLRRLFMGLNAADPKVAGAVLSAWLPASAARAIEGADSLAYDDLDWFLVGVREHSPSWVEAVGPELDAPRFVAAASKARAGYVDAVFKAVDILNRLKKPVVRSMLRDIVGSAATVAGRASLKDIYYHPHIGDYLFYFGNEVERLLGAFDSAKLAEDLASATPREWQTLLEIGLAFGKFGEAFLKEIIDRLDVDLVVANADAFAEHYAQRLRPLIWLLSYGSEGVRKRLAPGLAGTVERVLSAHPSEREDLLKALVALDSGIGGQLAARFGVHVPPEAVTTLRKFDDLEGLIAPVRRAFEEADSSGKDYDVFALLHELMGGPGANEGEKQ